MRTISFPGTRRTIMDATTSPRASFSLTPLRTMSRGCTDTGSPPLAWAWPRIIRYLSTARHRVTDAGGAANDPRSPHRPRADDPLATRHRAHRKELDHRGGAAHADEQPRSGSRRAPAGARRLRRDRPRGPRLEMLRRDRRGAPAARRRRVAARPVRQAGGGVQDPPGLTARADRELEPRAALGDLGALQRARPQG